MHDNLLVYSLVLNVVLMIGFGLLWTFTRDTIFNLARETSTPDVADLEFVVAELDSNNAARIENW